MVKDFLMVAVGGALGSVMRYGFSCVAVLISVSGFVATLAANFCGSFLIGMLMAASSSSPYYLMGTVGLCGGFTTFSTFSSNTLQMLQTGQYVWALGYMAISVIGSIFCVALGLYVGRMIH